MSNLAKLTVERLRIQRGDGLRAVGQRGQKFPNGGLAFFHMSVPYQTALVDVQVRQLRSLPVDVLIEDRMEALRSQVGCGPFTVVSRLQGARKDLRWDLCIKWKTIDTKEVNRGKTNVESES